MKFKIHENLDRTLFYIQKDSFEKFKAPLTWCKTAELLRLPWAKHELNVNSTLVYVFSEMSFNYGPNVDIVQISRNRRWNEFCIFSLGRLVFSHWIIVKRAKVRTFGKMNTFPSCWKPHTETAKFIKMGNWTGDKRRATNTLLNSEDSNT